MKKIVIFFLFVIVLSSCDPTIDTPIGTGDLGSLGTDNKAFVYVAIGNSLTAGGNSGALFTETQKYSYPQLIARQIGVGEFVQPDISSPGIGDRIFLRGFNAAGLPILETMLVQSSVNNLTYPKPFNNLGVYAAIANDLIDTSDFTSRAAKYGNPYYQVVLRDQRFGKSMIDQAIALKPNLLTIELGINDAFWYAIYGGTKSTFGMPDNPVPTPPEAINAIFTAGLTKLTTALPNTKIVLFNYPNILGFPYFTTVPWNALVIDEKTAQLLNQAYSALGFKFAAGPNGFVAVSPKSPGGLRQLTANDCLLLGVPQDSLKAGWGSLKPIPNEFVLDSFEIMTTTKAINDYNIVINQLKNTFPNIYIFDFHSIFANGRNTIYRVPGSSALTSKFISGGLFSLDGVHPTPKGYGVIANEFIKFLNGTFNSDIPLVNISNLPSNSIIPYPGD